MHPASDSNQPQKGFCTQAFPPINKVRLKAQGKNLQGGKGILQV